MKITVMDIIVGIGLILLVVANIIQFGFLFGLAFLAAIVAAFLIGRSS